MKYTDNTQYKEYIKQLVGKKILFKLTEDEDDEGLIGKLIKFDDELFIFLYSHDMTIVVKLYEVYYIEEYKEVKNEE